MENLDFNTLEGTRRDEFVLGTLMRNVYLWMTLALVITGLTAMVSAQSVAFMTLIFTNDVFFYGLFIVELVLVFGLSASIHKISFGIATLLFILYSIVNGLTMSVIFLAFELGSIANVFFITAGTFAGLAFVGSVTKKDLSGMGKFLMMTLIGLLIATVVNIIIKNSMFDFIISVIGVLLFAGLTVYDSNKIRQMLSTAEEVDDNMMKLALMGSLELYLDFINMFLYLLRLFGKRK